jgi:hypothetical protein
MYVLKYTEIQVAVDVSSSDHTSILYCDKMSKIQTLQNIIAN